MVRDSHIKYKVHIKSGKYKQKLRGGNKLTNLHTTGKIRQALVMAGATLALGGVMLTSNTTQAEASTWDERSLDDIQLDIQEVKESESIEYQIQWGDTLGNIAKALDMEVSTLANANGIGDIDVIIAGQYLVISEDSEGHTQVKVQEESSKPEGEVQPSASEPKEEVKAEAEAKPEVKEQPKEEAKPEVKAQAPAQQAQPVQATTSAHEAFNQVVAEKGISQTEANHWAELIRRESNWNITATNPRSGAYGLPQSLPANKMASEGSDYLTNPVTQLRWMEKYVSDRYGSFAEAINHHNQKNWY